MRAFGPEYDAVKRRAAATASDIDEYVELKSEVVGRILGFARISSDERAMSETTNQPISGRGAAG